MLQTVLPRSRGTFFTSRSATPTKDSAVSRICVMMPFGKPSIDSRCFSLPSSVSCGLYILVFFQGEVEPAFRILHQLQVAVGRQLHVMGAELRGDRQFAAA